MRKIKWAWQRVLRGYDDRLFWGLDGYLADNIIPGVKRFCEKELENKEVMELNLNRKGVFLETLAKIEHFKKTDWEDQFSEDNSLKTLVKYIAENINIYWG